MPRDEQLVENQFFIGVPWKGIRPKFEKAIKDLYDEYPVHCVIFGRNTDNDAKQLWTEIQKEIRASAVTIFDVTDSNPNVALEFGYAEALSKKSILTFSARKTLRDGQSHSSSLMSDLAGTIRQSYKSNNALKSILRKTFDANPYVVRFKKVENKHKFGKKDKKVAVAAVHLFLGCKTIKKPDLIINLQTKFPNYTSVNIPNLISNMISERLLISKTGPNGGISTPRIK